MQLMNNIQQNSVVKARVNSNSCAFRANKVVSTITEKVSEKTLKLLAASISAIAIARIAKSNIDYKSDKNFQDEILKTYNLLIKRNLIPESKLFLNILCVCKEQDILEEICANPKMLQNMQMDEEKIKQLEYKQVDTLEKDLVVNLLLMKQFYPEEYEKLTLSKGYKEIKDGNLNAKILENLKYNDKIDERYFYKIFDDIEKFIDIETVKIAKNDKDYLKTLRYVLEIDPSMSKEILDCIHKAKQPEIMKQVVYLISEDFKKIQVLAEENYSNQNFISPKVLAQKCKSFVELLKQASSTPNITKFALSFNADSFDTLTLINTIKNAELDLRTKKEVKNILNEYKPLIGANSATKAFEFVERTENLELLERVLDEFTQKDMHFFDLDTILDNVTDDNVDYFEQKLDDEDFSIYSLASILALGDVEDFYEFEKQEQILKMLDKHTAYFDSYMKKELEDIKTELDRYSQSYVQETDPETLKNMKTILSGFFITNLKAKKNYVPLVNIELSNPVLYKKLKDSGIIEKIQKEQVASKVLIKLNDSSEINSGLLKDIEEENMGHSTILKFRAGTTLAEALSKSNCGDVLSIDKQLYINDGSSKLYKWSLTEEQYLGLFPIVTRFDTSQGILSDCYLISALISCMENNKARAEIFKSFSSNGEDITVTIKAYENYGGSYTFKDGNIILPESGASLIGCTGLQMYEQAYARVAFREERYDSLPSLTAETTAESVMPRISGGVVNNVMSEVLGLNNLGGKRTLPNNFERSSVCICLEENKDDKAQVLTSILDLYANNEDYIINFGTIPSFDNKIESELNDKYGLFSQHAYSLKGYDSNTKMVQVINSHCEAVVTNIPLQELAKYVEQIYVTSLK